MLYSVQKPLHPVKKELAARCSLAPRYRAGMKAATFSGLLGDDERLRVVAAIALGARTIDDVAKSGDLAPQEVRRALPRLISAGVVQSQDGLRVDLAAFREAARERAPRRRELPDATPKQAQVLRNFVDDGRLRALPVRAAQRRVVLEYLAERFEKGIVYPEPAVNDLLGPFNDDYVSLRRALVDEGLLTRSGGRYRRT
jgi:hypothetical protein